MVIWSSATALLSHCSAKQDKLQLSHPPYALQSKAIAAMICFGMHPKKPLTSLRVTRGRLPVLLGVKPSKFTATISKLAAAMSTLRELTTTGHFNSHLSEALCKCLTTHRGREAPNLKCPTGIVACEPN